MVPTGVNNDFYTPPWIFERLAVRFDLDVCGPPGGVPWIPADRHYTLADDGLTAPWAGFVWLNPPFSQSTPWADRFRAHGNGVWLGPIANARWFVDLARGADRLYLCRDIAFVHPTHAGRRSSMPLASVAYGTRASEALARLAAADRVAGALVMNVPEVACA
jgi:hypothetical protein